MGHNPVVNGQSLRASVSLPSSLQVSDTPPSRGRFCLSVAALTPQTSSPELARPKSTCGMSSFPISARTNPKACANNRCACDFRIQPLEQAEELAAFQRADKSHQKRIPMPIIGELYFLYFE